MLPRLGLFLLILLDLDFLFLVSSSPSNPQSVNSSNNSLASSSQSPDNETSCVTESTTDKTSQAESNTSTFQDDDGSEFSSPDAAYHCMAKL